MGFLSREIVRRVGPLVAMGAAGAAGAVVAQRRLAQRRRLSLQPGPPVAPDPAPPVPAPPGPPAPPAPAPEPPTPTPDPIPEPVPAPHPEPPVPAPSPTPEPGIAIAGSSQGPEGAGDVLAEQSPRERILEETVRSALVEAAPEGAGTVEVEVAGSMVVLRGRVDSREAIRELERAAANVAGVDGVRVLLHLPGRAARRSA
jgi:hypothetical protein